MFYQSKIYFILMVEMLFFTFVILETETRKIDIYNKSMQIHDNRLKILDIQIKNNPEIIEKIINKDK